MGTNAKRPPQIRPVETQLPAAKPKPTKKVDEKKTTTKRPDRNQYKPRPTNSDNKANKEIQQQILIDYICIQALKETAQAELNRIEEKNKDLTSQNNIALAGYLGAMRTAVDSLYNLLPIAYGHDMTEEALLDTLSLPGGLPAARVMLEKLPLNPTPDNTFHPSPFRIKCEPKPE